MVRRKVELKQALFDGLFWSYSLLILLYFFFSQESAKAEMRTIVMIAAVLLVKMTILSLILQKVGQNTISAFIFGKPKASLLGTIPGWHLLVTSATTIVVGLTYLLKALQ